MCSSRRTLQTLARTSLRPQGSRCLAASATLRGGGGAVTVRAPTRQDVWRVGKHCAAAVLGEHSPSPIKMSGRVGNGVLADSIRTCRPGIRRRRVSRVDRGRRGRSLPPLLCRCWRRVYAGGDGVGRLRAGTMPWVRANCTGAERVVLVIATPCTRPSSTVWLRAGAMPW